MKNVAKVYNKLILIGNGFDLALGLKTSYNDFLFWLIKEEVLKALEHFPNTVTNKDYTIFNDYQKEYNLIEYYGFSRNTLFDVLVKKRHSIIPDSVRECKDLKSLQDTLKHFDIDIVPKNKQSLFQKILELSEVNWIDIEETYFDLVKESLSPKKNLHDIDILNEDLKQISERLKEYLCEIEIDLKMSDANNYVSQFYDVIAKKDIIEKQQQYHINPKHIYFLNFNYTESLNVILEQSGLEHLDITINQIHSNAFSDEPIIFGFGDEMDELYKKIEELNDNRYFKFIKSFQYFKSNKYRKLLRFLNSNYYQVCIYGHSCGLSDRVMLNEIFEHKNCKSIKIYYYNNDDFTTKTMNISRHFNSNKEMREKIVNFSGLNIIPQIINED